MTDLIDSNSNQKKIEEEEEDHQVNGTSPEQSLTVFNNVKSMQLEIPSSF